MNRFFSTWQDELLSRDRSALRGLRKRSHRARKRYLAREVARLKATHPVAWSVGESIAHQALADRLEVPNRPPPSRREIRRYAHAVGDDAMESVSTGVIQVAGTLSHEALLTIGIACTSWIEKELTKHGRGRRPRADLDTDLRSLNLGDLVRAP